MANNISCYSCKSKVNSFDFMECGELIKQGRHVFIDWWYWNGFKKNEPCPDICPLLANKGMEDGIHNQCTL